MLAVHLRVCIQEMAPVYRVNYAHVVWVEVKKSTSYLPS